MFFPVLRLQVHVHGPGYLGVYQTQSHTPGESIWQGAMLHSSVRSLHVLRHDISLLGETVACYLRPAEAGPGHVICRLLLRPLHQNEQNRQDFQRRERRRGGGQAALHQPVFSGEPPRLPPAASERARRPRLNPLLLLCFRCSFV